MKTRRNILTAVLMLSVVACRNDESWTNAEKSLIKGDGEAMRVLTIYDKADSLVLRTECSGISTKELTSDEYKILAEKMVATVTSPEQDGVGIAGPQVGISRRVVAVQRFDKDGEPFEVYPNIQITCHRGEKALGPEGCLSIPGKRGNVERYQDIDINYTSLKTLRDTTESIKGFTAVIFQHECDHLNGILYTDYLDEFKAAMTAGVPIPDSFNCGIGDEEAYHFKDLGWIHFHPYRCESENEREKIRRNVRVLGMKHKYEEPDWLK